MTIKNSIMLDGKEENKALTKTGVICSLIFLSLFFSISLVSAVPPVTNVQQFVNGITIKVPTDNIWQAGEDFEIGVHLFNISTGLPIQANANCYMHLYNNKGTHQLEMTDSTVSHTFDYSFPILGGNITPDVTGYVVQCNTSTIGGFHEVEVEVTPDGFDDTFQFYLIILLILTGIIILGFSIKEVWFVVLGGLGFIMLGVYTLNSGLIGFKDMYMTWGIALFEIAVGTILSVGAGMQKMHED